MAKVVSHGDKGVRPFWYKKLNGEAACHDAPNTSGQIKRKRVTLTVSKNSRDYWRNMVVVWVTDGSKP